MEAAMTAPWRRTAWILVTVLLFPALVLADGGGGGGGDPAAAPPKREDPDYTAGVKAIEAKQYAKAIPLLESSVQRTPNDADAWNWLAYATRLNGDPAKAIPLYEKALALDPKHLGAHEYMGEAYLALNNLPKAKEHLAQLDRLCLLSCEQYRDLKKAIQAYEKKAKPAAGK
jgi:tetratricopeptide (TPR) repeat protein